MLSLSAQYRVTEKKELLHWILKPPVVSRHIFLELIEGPAAGRPTAIALSLSEGEFARVHLGDVMDISATLVRAEAPLA